MDSAVKENMAAWLRRTASRAASAHAHGGSLLAVPARWRLPPAPLLAPPLRPLHPPPSRALCTAAPSVGEVVDAEQPAVRDASPGAFLAFESPKYARFVNMIMRDGKKETARKLLWRTFSRLREGGHEPQDVFHGALENVRPMMEMRTFRSGPVPFPLNPRRAEGQAMKWIVAAARRRGGTASFDRCLAEELLAAVQHKGYAIQKREEVHKTAVANQAAAHFRWRLGAARPAGAIDMDRKQHRPQGRRAIRALQGAMPPPRRFSTQQQRDGGAWGT